MTIVLAQIVIYSFEMTFNPTQSRIACKTEKFSQVSGFVIMIDSKYAQWSLCAYGTPAILALD